MKKVYFVIVVFLMLGCSNDLSLSGTANCYIVSRSGAYLFQTVKGNSLESVGDVASAEVLWESVDGDAMTHRGDLIRRIRCSDGIIKFAVPYGFRAGNAVIAAKDKDDNILWSWHIWLSGMPKEQVYDDCIIMDRNLGTVFTADGKVSSSGLLYQLGSKDPCVLDTKSPIDSTGWNTTGQTKSIYDPCPVGWRVPDSGAVTLSIEGSCNDSSNAGKLEIENSCSVKGTTIRCIKESK